MIGSVITRILEKNIVLNLQRSKETERVNMAEKEGPRG